MPLLFTGSACHRPGSRADEKSRTVLRSSDINWTYLSPAAFFEPGQFRDVTLVEARTYDWVADAN